MERYLQSDNERAVNQYCDLAAKYGLTPTQLALWWCYQNELVASTIIGATSMEQLEENLHAYDIRLDDYNGDKKGDDDDDTAATTTTTILEEIAAIYKKYTDPTKSRNNPQ